MLRFPLIRAGKTNNGDLSIIRNKMIKERVNAQFGQAIAADQSSYPPRKAKGPASRRAFSFQPMMRDA